MVGRPGRLELTDDRPEETSTVPKRAKDLAGQLLDLQVEFVIAELSGPRFAEVVARDVDDLFRIASTLTMTDVIDVPGLKASARRLGEALSNSDFVADVAVATADAIYEMPASSAHLLGEVVDREAVEALIGAVLAMSRMHDRAMDRMAESPIVAAVAGQFVTKIVGDFLQQNRQMAERVPGVSSLFSIGLGAASKVRSATVDQFLGDAAGKSGQFAIRRTNGAIRDLIRDAPLTGAAIEVWDMHASEPISELRAYLSSEELRELVTLIRDIVMTAGGTEFAGDVLDACIDSFIETHASDDIASLLTGLGIERDELVSEIVRHGTPIIAAAYARGELDTLIRARLEPFYAAPQVQALLDDAAPRPG
jgi:hypothetical protein